MKNIFVIICSIIIPVFSLNEITPKFCVNCKFFMNSFMDNNFFIFFKNHKYKNR